jgi:hypothetical protein
LVFQTLVCGKMEFLRVATLVERNENEAVVVPVVGSARIGVCLESGVRRSVVLVHLEGNLACHGEDVFTFNLLFNKFYKCCSFSAVCKDNAVIACVVLLFNRQKVHSRQLLTAHTTLVGLIQIGSRPTITTKHVKATVRPIPEIRL